MSKLDLTINWVLHSDNRSPRSLKRWVSHGFFIRFPWLGALMLHMSGTFTQQTVQGTEQSGGLHSEVRQLSLHAADSSGRGRWNPGSACHTAQEF